MNSKTIDHRRRAGGGKPRATAIKLALWLAGLAGLLPGEARATTFYWQGTAGNNWSTPANWMPAGPPHDGDDLIFSNRVSNNINNDLPFITVHAMIFDQAFFVTGNPMTVTSEIACFATDAGVDINVDGLYLGGDTYLNAVYKELDLDTYIELGGYTLTATGYNGNYLDFPGEISGAGNFVLGGGTAYLDAFNGNNVSGSFLVEGGTLVLDSLYGGAVNTNLEVWSGATVSLMKGFQIYAPSVLVQASGTILLNNTTNSFQSVVMQGGLIDSGPQGLINLQGPLTVDATNATAEISGNLTIKNDLDFQDEVFPIQVNGPWAPGLALTANVQGGDFTKTGFNSVDLEGTNTLNGVFDIQQGIVEADTSAAFGTSAVALDGGAIILRGVNIGNLSLDVSRVAGLQLDGVPAALMTCFNTSSWAGPVYLSTNLFVLDEGDMTFGGQISGPGGLGFGVGTAHLTGSQANTFTGPLFVQCQELDLGKPYNVRAFGGPLVVGGGPASLCEVVWLNSYQANEANPVLYANALLNLNNLNDNFGSLTFNGGYVSTGNGTLELDGPVTANPTNVSAVMYGNLTLPPGNAVPFNIGQGSEPGGIDLLCNAAISGTALDLIKEGAGTMSLAGVDNYLSTTLVQQGILDVDNAFALSTAPVVVSGGATLRFDVGATLSQSFELDGAGLNGTLGAIDDVVSNVAVTLNGPILLDAETAFNIGQEGFLFIDGAVSGTGPFTEVGPGAISLSGTSANTYTGGTFVNQGLLDLGKSGGLTAAPGNLSIGTITRFHHNGTTATVLCFQDNPISGPTVIVNGGSLLNLNDQNQTLQSVTLNSGGSINTESGTLTLNGGYGTMVVGVNPDSSGSVIAGNLLLPTGGNFTVNGYTGALLGHLPPELDVPAVITDTLPEFIEKDGGGQMRLSAPNTFNSAVTVNAGTLTVLNSSGLGTTSFGASVNNGAVLALSNNVTLGKFLTLNSTNSSGALQSLGGSNVLTGGITLSQTANISVNPGSGYLALLGAIGGPGGLTSGGLGTLQLEGTNANTYAGLTTVGSGVLEAARYRVVIRRNPIGGYLTTNKVSQTCIPGDVVIGSDALGSFPAALQIDYLQQFPATASIADLQSGSLNFVYLGAGQLQPAVDTIQSLTGSGQVNLVLNSSLYVANTPSFTFYGSVNGDGAFGLDGPGTMTTWGNFNTTGSVSVGGGDWEFFGARHNGGLYTSGGRLAGDGTVDGAVVVSGAYAGASLGVDSHVSNPQAGVFHMGSLSNGPSVTIQLDMFGPSPAGGNDQIVTTSGGVSLASDTVLQTSFSYPPRDGDVIDLISVAAGQTISGTFSNYPEGVMTLVGQTPVLPSYHGGAGHDFTLTVTNLALAYVGYQLAEGNDNQTVEPDECNLLYVTLINRRTSPLTITNAYLRATNAIGVVVTVPVATFPVIPAGQTLANITPFQFSTDTNLPCGGAVGFELVLGVVGEGQFAINFNPVSGADCSHPTGPCDSCTQAYGLFDTNTPTTAQPLYFIGAPSIAYPPKAYPGTNPAPFISLTPYLAHSFTNSITNLICVTAKLEFNCPAAPTNALGVAAYLGNFDPNNPATGYLGDIGQGGPPYPSFAFQVPAGTNFTIVVMAQATNLPCSNYLLQLFGLPCPAPILAIQPEPTAINQVRVTWSTAYPGGTVQQSGKLGGATFSNVIQSPIILNRRYSLTNLPAITNQFYRLKM
ncbi:MAG: autotransporter-associated beta strand repeat-containing protein [Verrucomicrobiota bacterium]